MQAEKDKQAEEVGQEEEKEAFVLRRKVKSTGEPIAVEHPPIILLTKKTLQEEGHEKDTPIEIDEDKEETEEEALKRKDKGKGKVEEEGRELVQHKKEKSALTPGDSQAKEIEDDDSSEDEDEVRIHLTTMLKAM